MDDEPEEDGSCKQCAAVAIRRLRLPPNRCAKVLNSYSIGNWSDMGRLQKGPRGALQMRQRLKHEGWERVGVTGVFKVAHCRHNPHLS